LRKHSRGARWLRVEFEWDAEKAQANLSKHGVSFETAAQIFKRDRLNVRAEWVENEFRETDIGIADNLVIFVVAHTDRSGITRIISARRATRNERKLFDDYYS